MLKHHPAIHVFLLLLVLGGGAAHSAELTFSPSPAVAGQPVTATFESVAFGCITEGALEVDNVFGNEILLEATPPGCPIIPIGFVDYTASTSLGPLAAGTYTILVIAAGSNTVLAREILEVKTPPVCSATETSLCLGDGRFEVTGNWRDFAGNQGVAKAVPDDFKGLGNFGVLWFFSQDNPEMVVKVLDGCSYNGYYWVFLSPASTVEYQITVRDVRTGQTKIYGNPLGNVPSLTADTRAFACAAP
jgi:hypothetical protein